MTDRQAFLHAIIDRPDDDLLRLVYADFLEEAGDSARAELIRLQIEQAATEPDSEGWVLRNLRIAELTREHEWKIPGLKGKQEFRRGFVEIVWTTAERLLELPTAVFDSTPVRELQVRNAAGFIPEIARLPWIARVSALDLRNNHLGTGDRMESFFSQAEPKRLRSLSMTNNILWADDLETFFRSWPNSQQLTALDLAGNPLGDAGAEVLAVANLPHLQTLVLRADDQQFADCLHAYGVGRLAESYVLRSVRHLDLRGHHIGDSGLIDLVRSPNVSQLQVLDVGFNDIGETGDSAVEALLASGHLTELRILRLNGNTIDRLWVEALAKWDHLDRMELVDLRRCRLGAGARIWLERSPHGEKFLLD